MRTTKTKPVQPIHADRKQQTQAPPARPDLYAERRADINKLKSLKLFSKLEDPDLVAVLALVELFEFDEHGYGGGSLSYANNWLGSFVSEILIGIAHHGPQHANCYPRAVLKNFDDSLDDARRVLELHKDITSKLPTLQLASMPHWHCDEYEDLAPAS